MRVGVTMLVTDRSMGPADLAREVEARGFDSLFVPEHTHIPAARRTPYPLGGELPEEYRRTLDPFVALTAAAAATTRLRVGTGICLVAQRDPIVTAKEVASLDYLSGGRFVFGVGYGWNREEIEDHGVDFRGRRALVREKVLTMRRLWEDEEASFEGERVRLESSWAYPKPVQRPHPPILLGGAAGPTLFAHVAEYGDGWIPVGAAGIGKLLPELRAALEAAGRDPSSLEVVPYSGRPSVEKLHHFAEVGITETVLTLPSAGRDAVLPVLDSYGQVLAAYRA